VVSLAMSSPIFFGEAQRTDLRSERTGNADLASSDSDEDLDDLGGGFQRRAGFWGFRVLEA
jgi:hypothetical protein